LLRAWKKRHFVPVLQRSQSYRTAVCEGRVWQDISSLVAIVGGWRRASASRCECGYTVSMNSEAIERLETKIAFLESANLELSDVLYRQQQEIRELRERLDALAQQVLAGQTPQVERSLEDERPPHY
jgi:SlyX protein